MTIDANPSMPALRAVAEPMAHNRSARVSLGESSRFAYKFLIYRFWIAVRLLWLPILLAQLTLYVCMMGYFRELLRYLADPDPKAASLALGLLAGGTLSALFFLAIAIARIAGFVLGEPAPHTWLCFRAHHKEWRLYGAFLRFLPLWALIGGGLALFLTVLAPLLPGGSPISGWILRLTVAGALFWFFVRVGFLMPPLVADTDRTILRSAWRETAGNTCRVGALVLVLLAPAVLIEAFAEILVHVRGLQPVVPSDDQIATYVHVAERGLVVFTFTSGIASFFSIVLLTAGATAVHRHLASRQDQLSSAQRRQLEACAPPARRPKVPGAGT